MRVRVRTTPRAIKLAYILGSTLLLTSLVLAAIERQHNPPAETIAGLENSYRVGVYIDNPNTHKATLEPQEQAALAMGEPASDSLPAALDGVKRALERYPPELIERHLTSIHLVGNLRVQGIPAAGSFAVSKRALYLRADDQTARYGEVFYAETFHHEFSSLLVYQGNFPLETWKATTPAGFRYQYNWQGFEQRPQRKENLEPSERLKRGFLNQHAMTRLDDDVNAYAEKLFEHPEELIDLAQTFPVIRQKACLLISFYTQQAKSMADAFAENYPDAWCD